MRKLTKVLVLTLVLALGIGVGTTAQAAKVKVKKVTSVDKLTGKKTIKLTAGKKATLSTTVTVTPDKSKNKKVTYKTSKKKVAVVSKKGVITAKKTGKATITVASKANPKKKAKVKVTVVKGKVTSVTLDKTTVSMKAGESLTLKATVKTSGKKPNKSVVWSSSDEAVATVSEKGVVKAVKAGSVQITAMATDGTQKKAVCTVTVTEAATPTPPAPTTSYTVTVSPVDNAEVTAKVVFSDTKRAQEDVNKLAAFVTNDKDFIVNLDGEDYNVTIVDGQVRINGKTLAESEKAYNAKEVTVKMKIKADKVSSVVAFTPKSVASVAINNVVFTDIKADSFKINTATFTYKVAGKNLEVTGTTDPQTALQPLVDAKIVTITK